jgi:hypothetical protein
VEEHGRPLRERPVDGLPEAVRAAGPLVLVAEEGVAAKGAKVRLAAVLFAVEPGGVAIFDAEQGQPVVLFERLRESAKLRDGFHRCGAAQVRFEVLPVERGQELLKLTSRELLKVEVDLGRG